MSSVNDMEKLSLTVDEEEIFKSLSNKKRREIIKIVGNEGKLTFTEIKNFMGSIDSPTLSYHIKSLSPILVSEENKYKLSEIGKATYNLLRKTGIAHSATKYKKNLIYAYIITVVCWTVLSFIVPMILFATYNEFFCQIPIYLIQISIAIISGFNYVIIWKLRK